jgi:hypothetical protein
MSANVAAGRDFGYNSDKLYDINIIAGFARYICFGLPPGGFEGTCIAGDYELATHRASQSIRPRPSVAGGGMAGTATEDIVANMIEFAKDNIPEEGRGGPLTMMRWMQKDGLSKDKDARLLYKLGHDVRWINQALHRTGLDFDWETGEYDPHSD